MWKMKKGEHKKRHEKLHKALDELVADFICNVGKLPDKTFIIELMDWSFEQTQNPTELK